MTEQTNNPQPGYAARAYPLADLTRPLPPLTAFQAFVAAAELGSFNRAAEHLCRTQGAVSRQVQRLEAHYRCALFVRHPAGLTLTAEGGALLTVAIDVLAQLAQHAHAHAHSASALTLRLPSTFAIRWLLPRLPAVNHALSRTELRIHTSADDTPDFTDADVDAIVVRGTGSWAGMMAVPLFDECLTPMCTREAAASLKSIADLAHATLLHPARNRDEWRCWLDAVGATRIDPRTGLVFDTLELTLTAAAHGHGVAIGDPRMAADRLATGALVTPFPEVVRNGLGYYLVYPAQRAAQPAIQALAEVLTRLARED
ncbi:TPA: LysR family transcriptional regulator [Burkholderia territorii]|uniref:LysR substrate-binding domain-containing protein n=1 Tax=Burkholderia territorii TaxID=1503055 RepID=UPI0011CC0908|nr:LysR substrate-binding domain-containing protein [Burkholderia territorii]TXG05169.1 LysR family transcriptional regulator [Burkholderia territorii]HDR8856365.1 LysR family transcriptional regulator [Burkholderia territorii]HDR8862434.1 LysR family transcriptional regulator [Burkholderia territorii]HDR8868545.1 LysR family transcriptional regulator [Burkholderia territorii]HDR8874937.1 LysR family transcriptional regulator [Burkholderia territorii]